MNRAPQPGESGTGLVCKSCGMAFPIYILNPALLSKPFEAECSKCGHRTTYQAREIQVLQAHRKQ